MRKKSKLSAVIACYGDEQAIPIMYERLNRIFKRLGVEYEIIFVNDGSPDGSAIAIEALVAQDAHVIGVHHARNFSSQMAFTSGMDISTGDAVILMDGDLQDPPELIEAMYATWLQGYEVVYGIRTNRDTSWFMNTSYRLFYRIFHKLSYIKIPVDAGDFSLMDRKVVDALQSLPERDRFLRGLRAWVGFSQIGIPYVRPERLFGTTTNSLLKNFLWATKGIFSFSFVPLQFMTILSLIVFVLSVIGMVTQFVLHFVQPDIPRGTSTIIITVLFFGAVQMLGISILGEYISKIFEEVKQRPQYIRKSVSYGKKRIRK